MPVPTHRMLTAVSNQFVSHVSNACPVISDGLTHFQFLIPLPSFGSVSEKFGFSLRNSHVFLYI